MLKKFDHGILPLEVTENFVVCCNILETVIKISMYSPETGLASNDKEFLDKCGKCIKIDSSHCKGFVESGKTFLLEYLGNLELLEYEDLANKVSLFSSYVDLFSLTADYHKSEEESLESFISLFVSVADYLVKIFSPPYFKDYMNEFINLLTFYTKGNEHPIKTLKSQFNLFRGKNDLYKDFRLHSRDVRENSPYLQKSYLRLVPFFGFLEIS